MPKSAPPTSKSLNITEIADLSKDAINAFTTYLTLEIIAQGPTWGYRIKKNIEEIMATYITDFEFKISSLYTLLRRFEEKNGVIRSYKQHDDDQNRRNSSRRWYRITEVGKVELRNIRQIWAIIIDLHRVSPSILMKYKK